MRRGPSKLQPQSCDLLENGGDGKAQQVIHYPTDVQPVFDAKCVSCHGNEKADGGLKLTGEVTVYYNTSYEEIVKKQLAGPIVSEFTTFLRGDQGNYNGATLPPKSQGAERSVIITMLTDPDHPKNAEEDHSKMLTEMELMRLTRWADANYQFYGTYYGRHHSAWTKADPQKPAYKPEDFRRRPLFEEAISMSAPSWHQ